MRSSAKRHEYEQHFKSLVHDPQIKLLVKYLGLKKELLLTLLLSSNGEEAIALRGELNGIVKLYKMLSPAESQ